MANWDFLIDDGALASVLPDGYAHFAMPVREALTVFLEGLPEHHQAAILGQQARLPATASASQRLAQLARCCPVLHKLGQILARDRRLVPELRQELQQLESLPPTIPVETIRDVLALELGPLDRLGVTLVPPAIAEASVAVVIGFQQATDQASQRDGVFKILKPGIVQRLQQELELMERVAGHLDQRCDELGIPAIDYQQTFEQVRDKLRCEVRLDQEQRHLAEARAFFADEPRVLIPALFDHSTPRVTAMQRVMGAKVTDHGLDSWGEQRRLAGLVVEALIGRPLFSRDSQVLFHCDPHAGNLFFTKDRRLAILDWSLVSRLGEPERIAIVQIMLGALTLHNEQIVRVLAELSERPPDYAALRCIAEAWLRRIRQGQFPGLSWLIGLLDEAVQTARLRVGADLMLFRKTLHTLDGILLDLESEGLMDRVLLEEFLRHLMVEWPRRWVTTANSREFATRLSNLDLARWLVGFPETVSRFWAGQIRDLLSAYQPTAHTGS